MCQPEEEEKNQEKTRGERTEKEKKSLFVSYGNTQGQMQALVNYPLHLHIPGIRHYANRRSICIMDSSCCLSWLVLDFI